MYYTDKLIQLAKKKAGIESDYQLAQVLGIRRQKIANWRDKRSNPNGEMTTKLLHLAGFVKDEAIDIVSSKDKEVALKISRSWSYVLNVKDYVNPKRINYLRDVTNFNNKGEIIYIIRTVKLILKKLTKVNEAIINLFFSFRAKHITA